LKDYLEAEYCDDFNINRYYLPKHQETIFNNIIAEKKVEKAMREEFGIEYLNTTLLYGVSGTGKTTFGRYMAYKLDLDFVYVNYAKLIGGVLGNTAGKVSDIFRFMADIECIFMLDEIDYISQKRGTESEVTGGELGRLTTTLMQELDYFKKHKVKAIVLSATNRKDTMDPALLSRFAVSYELKALNNQEKEQYIIKYLTDVGVEFDRMNVKQYCAGNVMLNQRNIESDMNRCLAEYIRNGHKDYKLYHIN